MGTVLKISVVHNNNCQKDGITKTILRLGKEREKEQLVFYKDKRSEEVSLMKTGKEIIKF